LPIFSSIINYDFFYLIQTSKEIDTFCFVEIASTVSLTIDVNVISHFPVARPDCSQIEPPLEEKGSGHQVACRHE